MSQTQLAIVTIPVHELRGMITDAVSAALKNSSPVKQIMTPGEAAAYLGKKEGTLRHWRSQAKGPKFVKGQSGVLYRKADIDAWIDEHSVHTIDSIRGL
jgi:predicted DNA-binding transcriptional regulator AlpA